MKVAVIGSEGFVGGAMVRTFEEHKVEVVKIDKKNEESLEGYKQLTNVAVVFIAVPTPYDPVSRAYDYSAIIEVLERLSYVVPRPMICLRSTITPEFFESHLAHLVSVHQPEFLCARSAYEDFNNPDIHIIGIKLPHPERETPTEVLKELYAQCDIKPKETIYCTLREAAALKLIHNVYRATRISFLNEMHVFAENRLEGWESLQPHLAKMFGARDFGGHYLDVPGPDGQFGYGGACFPKDMAALIGYLEDFDLPCEILNAARSVNGKMRLHK
jgi:UDPglucose 6-dehydrogenase